jgi:hypothetical protein
MNWRNLFTLPAALLSAGATLLCPERGQASTGQSPQNVHVMLEVSHGSGSGAYAPSSTVSISANSPSDNSVFLGWIKLSECDGQITDANSQSTTFQLGEQDAKVTAVFATLEKTWFPPGPEDNTKGLLLPKPSGGAQPVRLKQAIRVKITADDEASLETIRDKFEVKLQWSQAAHAKFFDSAEGGQSLTNAEPVPKDLFVAQDRNLNATVYYHGNYEPSADEPPTVNITLTLKRTQGSASSSSGPTLSASLVPVEFVTPAGDPVNAPLEGGDGSGTVPDGANELTYSTASPGVLTLKLKARVVGLYWFSGNVLSEGWV